MLDAWISNSLLATGYWYEAFGVPDTGYLV